MLLYKKEYLTLLIFLPFILYLIKILFYSYLSNTNNFISNRAINRLIPKYNRFLNLKRELIIFSLFYILTAIALAQPQWGIEKGGKQVISRDLLFILDVSKSMDANDILPSRLEKSKAKIKYILKNVPNDRVALMSFAETSNLILPFTYDHSVFSYFLDALQTDLLGEQGTSIEAALLDAIPLFDVEIPYANIIILFSDGENHGKDISEAIKKINDKKINVITFGVGTKKGSLIPLKDGGFLTDFDGSPVKTKLNDKTLKKIAEKSKGIYLPVTNNNKDVKTAVKYIKKLKGKQSEYFVSGQKEEQFQIFVLAALLIYVLYLFRYLL